MKTEMITAANIENYIAVFPDEYLPVMAQPDTKALGVIISDIPCGALVWKDSDDTTVRLLSIYVLPEYRRLGAASLMMQALSGKKLSFSYEAVDDRVTLEPFFEAIGVEVSRNDCEVGVMTIGAAREALENKKLDRNKPLGMPWEKLLTSEKISIKNWLLSRYKTDCESYTVEKPASIFFTEEDDIKAAILLSSGEGGTINLDFAYAKPNSQHALAGVLYNALITNEEFYDADTSIEMLLTTESGRGLYRNLFGEPTLSVPVISAGH